MMQLDIQEKFFGATHVLGPISLAIVSGECVAILGPSGVGKSTLLRIAAGIDCNFKGSASRPAKTAMVFQDPTLLSWRTALENITLIHPDLAASAAMAILERVGLAGKAGLFPGQLSLGQQRRLSLARAISGDPELLILDEPYVSLDAETSKAMITLTEELLAESRPATLLVTHAPAEAERLADKIFHPDGHPATLA